MKINAVKTNNIGVKQTQRFPSGYRKKIIAMNYSIQISNKKNCFPILGGIFMQPNQAATILASIHTALLLQRLICVLEINISVHCVYWSHLLHELTNILTLTSWKWMTSSPKNSMRRLKLKLLVRVTYNISKACIPQQYIRDAINLLGGWLSLYTSIPQYKHKKFG